MLSLGSIAFASPWLLIAAAALPGLWFLLRVTPPAARRLRFPALRLLIGLTATEETPARTPLWLLALRTILAFLVIVALAHPLLHPSTALPGSGPVVVAIDNGWAAAPDWARHQAVLRDLAARVEREGREFALVPTATASADGPPTMLRPVEAAGLAAQLQPEPWPDDRAAAARRLRRLPAGAGDAVYWLSDGIAGPDDRRFVAALARLGPVTVLAPPDTALARLLAPGDAAGTDLTIRVVRAATGPGRPLALAGYGADGALLVRAEGRIPDMAGSVDIALHAPVELRNRLQRVQIEGESSAGATLLLDAGQRRGSIGIVTDHGTGDSAPLLSPAYFIGRALAPYAELRRGTVASFLNGAPGASIGMIVLPDGAVGAPETVAALQRWIEAGGVLLRFAGPELAEAPDDALLPVALRQGGRSIGGVMSWENPAHLAAFPTASPLAGLAIPADVTVQRQLLAEPAVDLDAKTWARLSDGTPLVTAAKRGSGSIVLVHTTASSAWSNLALSGLFVDLLRRIDLLATGGSIARHGLLPPWRTLDGFGRLGPPAAGARPIDLDRSSTSGGDAATISAAAPPGFYGTADDHMARNLYRGVPPLAPLGALPDGIGLEPYSGATEFDLRPLAFGAALALFLIDLAASFALRGVFPAAGGAFARRPGKAAAALICLAVLITGNARAAALDPPAAPSASPDAFAIEATAKLHLGYVVTGDASVDQTSRAGLDGLDSVLARRTAVETGEPVGIDVERDELIFFPLIYWPVTAAQKPLSAAAAERVNRYLATGGTLLIDTRDQGLVADTGEAGATRLRALLQGVHVPPLVPVPPDHVLTRSFYLLQDFPGRAIGGTLWVEPLDDHVNDGVSTVVMGANDWAAAWAVDAEGEPEFPVTPGGEQQREMAYRFGVNIVMYALTGNYKADQVHVPAILERLGQ